MNNTKAYTAQEMRRMAGFVHCPNDEQEKVVSAMLRQAAEDEEELAELRDQVNRDFGESVSLKARLDTVVKECEKMRDDFSKHRRSFTGIFALNMRSFYEDKIAVVDGILRTARGEGGAE